MQFVTHVLCSRFICQGSVPHQRSGQRLPIFEETLVIVRGRWNNARRGLAARWNMLVNAVNRR